MSFKDTIVTYETHVVIVVAVIVFVVLLIVGLM